MAVMFSDAVNITLCSGWSTDVPLTAPPPPTSFSLSARDEIGRFNVTSATSSQTEPTDQISAFVFRIKSGQDIYYIVQVDRIFNLAMCVCVCTT